MKTTAHLIALASLMCWNVANAVIPPKSFKECIDALQTNEKTARIELLNECMTGDAAPRLDGRGPLSGAYLMDVGIYNVDSAGGVEPHAWIGNANAASPIKYLRLQVTMYNAVGDAIRSEIGGASTRWIEFTGPLAATDGPEHVTWGPVWYNTTADCLKVQSMTIEFLDGKKLSFAGKALKRATISTFKNDCRMQR